MILSNTTKSSFMNQVISNLSSKGYDVSNYSNLYNVLDAIIDSDDFDKINDVIKSLNFSEKSGTELDLLFELFGIVRQSNPIEADQAHFEFLFQPSTPNAPSVYFKAGAMLVCDGKYYKVMNDNKFSNISTVQTLICQAISGNYNFAKSLTVGGVTFLIDDNIYTNGINGVNLPDATISIMSDSLTFLDMKDTDTASLESDSIFRSRASNLFSNFGMNNLKLIEQKIKSIPGVTNIITKEYDYYTEIFIMPSSISLLNDIISNAQEVVNYYKISRIDLKKPPYVKFTFDGILSQFNVDQQVTVKNSITQYIQDLSINGNLFNRDNFENMLYDIGNSLSNQFVLNEGLITVTFGIYSENAYDVANPIPVIEKTIEENEIKTFNGVIFVCGDIK